MKNTIIFAGLFLGMLFMLSIAFAAPAANQFVINNQTNQCAMYWPGDEFTSYTLPDNWTIAELNTTGLNATEEINLMNITCQNMSYVYIGQLMNLTKVCISNCTNNTFLNETNCMCQANLSNQANITANQTINQTANKTVTANQTQQKSAPSINMTELIGKAEEKLSDPIVLAILTIVIIAIIVVFYFRKKGQTEHAEAFNFPPP
jgi:hypothetical protein